MKYGFLIGMALLAGNAIGQVFHFENDHTVIIKNTTQSPAHWYLQITNDCGVDTTLRWVAEFQAIPSQWVINFDAQNQSWSPVEDGDSSDFTLFVPDDLPQKLIIGAMLNNTPGHGSVFFHIFDPNNRTQVDTIEYEFIISPAGLEEIATTDFLQLKDNFIIVSNGQSTQFTISDASGRKLLDQPTVSGISLAELPKNQVLFLTVQQGKKTLIFKFLQ